MSVGGGDATAEARPAGGGRQAATGSRRGSQDLKEEGTGGSSLGPTGIGGRPDGARHGCGRRTTSRWRRGPGYATAGSQAAKVKGAARGITGIFFLWSKVHTRGEPAVATAG